MKKNFMTALAIMVVAFFVSTEIAKAADISFSGQIRTRWEQNEQGNNGGNGAPAVGKRGGNAFASNSDSFINSSVRLAATANVSEGTSAFIQMQSVRTWGSDVTGGVATAQAASGSGNGSNVVSDNDATVGVHQAYFTLKNILMHGNKFAVDAQVGRQEIILDGHRIFGNTIWTMGMQTHDAIRVNHSHENISFTGAYILGTEAGRVDDPGDDRGRDVWMGYMKAKNVLGGQFSAYFVYDENTPQAAAALGHLANEVITIGGRQAGKTIWGIDYRAEYYHQMGSADNQMDRAQQRVSEGVTSDRDAYMFGVRVGKNFKNVRMNPTITLMHDYLSGTTDEDQRNNDWQSFNTVFDTGHKFYGLMDVFLGVGGGGTTGTQGLGLIDTAVKAKFNPLPGWTVKMDYHWFSTAEGYQANTVTSQSKPLTGTGSDNRDHGDQLGQELDITVVTKYNENTKVMLGYSHFDQTATFQQLKNTGSDGTDLYGQDNADWAYVMFDVRF